MDEKKQQDFQISDRISKYNTLRNYNSNINESKVINTPSVTSSPVNKNSEKIKSNTNNIDDLGDLSVNNEFDHTWTSRDNKYDINSKENDPRAAKYSFDAKYIPKSDKYLSHNKNLFYGNVKEREIKDYVDHYIPCFLIRNPRPTDKTLIYFHANAESLETACLFVQNTFLPEIPMNILIVEYKGYTFYEGSCSQESIYQDSEHIINYLLKILDVKEKNIFVVGRSIGTGPACY